MQVDTVWYGLMQYSFNCLKETVFSQKLLYYKIVTDCSNYDILNVIIVLEQKILHILVIPASSWEQGIQSLNTKT